MGHVRMGHDPDLVDVPRLQALFEELGPRETVLGGGIDRTDGGFACGEMIRVGCLEPVVPALGGLDQDALWLDIADDLDDLALQLPRGLQPTVAMALQESHILDAEDRGRSDLLALANGRHLLAVAVVEPALLAVRAQQDRDAQTGVHPTGDGPGRPEVAVVRVGSHYENPLDLVIGPRRGRLAEGPLSHDVSVVGSQPALGHCLGPRSSALVRAAQPWSAQLSLGPLSWSAQLSLGPRRSARPSRPVRQDLGHRADRLATRPSAARRSSRRNRSPGCSTSAPTTRAGRSRVRRTPPPTPPVTLCPGRTRGAAVRRTGPRARCHCVPATSRT